MPAPYPREIREGVVRAGQSREDSVTLAQIGTDFSIHEMKLSKWIRQVGIDDGSQPSKSLEESPEPWEASR